MQGQVSSSYGSWSGTGTDKRYVPLDQTTCSLLSLVKDRSGTLSVPVMGSGEMTFLCFFLASLWCLVHMGGASFASVPPCVYRAWVTSVCLLLDTPFGRRSLGALST